MIDSVLRLIGKGKEEAEGLEVFAGLLLNSTLARSLEGIDRSLLTDFARQAFRHLLRKPHKRHAINFTTSNLLGGGAPCAVLEILNDDMPFVVESVISELHTQGLMPRLVFHPVFKVKRYGSGRLQAVVGPGDRYWSAGDQESYIAVLLDPLSEQRQARLLQALDPVLDDVRAAAADSEPMKSRIAQAIGSYEKIQLGLNAAAQGPEPLELKEACDFLRWLGQGNFTLLGVRDYELVGLDGSTDLWPAATGALGIARAEAAGAGKALERPQMPLTPPMREVYNGPSPLIFSKAVALSRVRRRVPLDSIGVKRYTQTGKLLGVTRLYGLFTPASYMQPVETVPVVRHKVRRALTEAQFPPDSHNARALVDILENFPRDELLQLDQRRLSSWAMALVDLSIRPRTAVLMRHDDIAQTTSALVFVPRDHYSSAVRERIGNFLAQRLGGAVAAFYPYISSSPLVRTHFIFTGCEPPATGIDDEMLVRGVGEIVKTWEERLDEALSAAQAGGRVREVQARDVYRGAFSAGYAERFTVERAVEDIVRIERLGPQASIAIDFYREADDPPHRLHAALYRFDDPIALSERVPLLENMGFRAIDERSYRVRPRMEGVPRDVVLHDMVLETPDGAPIDIARHEVHMEETFLAVFRGEAESDYFNALVVAAGLGRHEVVVLRALAAYMRQMRAPFGPRYIAETLVRYPAIARDLFELLRARLDARSGIAQTEREAASAGICQRIDNALGQVEGLDEDRILRRLLNLVLAVLRTNIFLRDAGGLPPAVLAFKLASREIDRLPEPKPYREIFVYSPRVEGVHLRFAPIARGGIRWSDRLQDYRTEILGLAKAQQVKNAVIVPSGAKGGFVPKRVRREAGREEVQAEGVACYRMFIEALLSLTDDIRDGAVLPPAGIIRRDGDDPYLVVAADKGTATFSDYANEISLARGFWLGDAFASGGSAGYDHKRMGITARGAWECVKRHFREMDRDIQTQPFSVVGVGDMSGDVFGNAMLLSPVIRLVAAFDHREIFIDPTPDTNASFLERKRLFELPRSSWGDYDRNKISTGGGVFPRSAKSIALSAEVRGLLGLDAAETTPAELIQAILRSEADLLWFGGIGTFVRETNELDEQVGDRANDALRVAASELRAKVIGEGANLGLTQRARIEAAMRGIRLNTDFIDNSAGVNTSDQEVNIKVALEPAVVARSISREDRNRLLAAMSSEVAASVLANNHAQSLALSLAERATIRDLSPFVRLIRDLEERRLIDRKLEALPSGADLTQRASLGKGLTRPELAVLMSWAKLALSADLLASDLPDGPEASRLANYFPSALRASHGQDIAAHRLRREIVVTGLTNTIVNCGGPDIMMRLSAAVPEAVPVLAEAFLAACEIFDVEAAWSRIDALDGKCQGGVQLDLYAALQGLCERETIRLLGARRGRTLAAMIAAYAPAARELASGLPGLLPPTRRAATEAMAQQLRDKGVPDEIASWHASLELKSEMLMLADRAAEAGASVGETARVLFAVAEHLSLDELRARAAALQPADEFDGKSIGISLGIVEKAARMVADRMLTDRSAAGMPIGTWVAQKAPALAAAHSAIEQALAAPGFSIARLGLVAEAVRGVSVRDS